MQNPITVMSVATALLACALVVLAAEETATTPQADPSSHVSMVPPPSNKRIAAMQAKMAKQGATGISPTSITDSQLQSAIQDRRYMMHQIKCALGEGPCDPVGRKLKALAPLVMKNICFQCTPVEKRQIQMVASHIQRNFPAEWSKMVRQYGST